MSSKSSKSSGSPSKFSGKKGSKHDELPEFLQEIVKKEDSGDWADMSDDEDRPRPKKRTPGKKGGKPSTKKPFDKKGKPGKHTKFESNGPAVVTGHARMTGSCSIPTCRFRGEVDLFTNNKGGSVAICPRHLNKSVFGGKSEVSVPEKKSETSETRAKPNPVPRVDFSGDHPGSVDMYHFKEIPPNHVSAQISLAKTSEVSVFGMEFANALETLKYFNENLISISELQTKEGKKLDMEDPVEYFRGKKSRKIREMISEEGKYEVILGEGENSETKKRRNPPLFFYDPKTGTTLNMKEWRKLFFDTFYSVFVSDFRIKKIRKVMEGGINVAIVSKSIYDLRKYNSKFHPETEFNVRDSAIRAVRDLGVTLDISYVIVCAVLKIEDPFSIELDQE